MSKDLATVTVKELTPGNVKAAMTGNQSQDLWMVDPSTVKIIKGYNKRTINAAYKERVRWLADRMKANGYDRKHPLGGFIAREADKDVIYLTAGHRRTEAVLLAIAEGAAIEKVPMVVSPRGANMEDLWVEQVTSNDGDQLTTYEKALNLKELAAMGLDSQRIADRVGLASAQYVDDLLLLAGSPLAVRRMVAEEVVSATTAIATIKKHGDAAADVLAGALAKSGGKKATAKNLPQAAFKRAVKKQAEPMYDALKQVTTDPFFETLSEELRGAIMGILGGITK